MQYCKQACFFYAYSLFITCAKNCRIQMYCLQWRRIRRLPFTYILRIFLVFLFQTILSRVLMTPIKSSNFYSGTMNAVYLMQTFIKFKESIFLFVLQICSNKLQKGFLLYIVQLIFFNSWKSCTFPAFWPEGALKALPQSVSSEKERFFENFISESICTFYGKVFIFRWGHFNSLLYYVLV